ncbi:MAG: hypothetical protein P3X22_006150 [Thermoprotei archaeon]|nr:hypothetical protein [Thermoprotei archaeon]
MSLLRIGYLLSAELYLGVAWGVVWSVYARRLVDSGFEGGYYGLAGLVLSLVFSLSTLLAGLSYDRGLRLPVALGSGFALVIGLAALKSNSLAWVSPAVLGVSMGFHAVVSVYTISACSRFKATAFTLAYSSSLLGVSIGAMLVALGLNVDGIWVYAVVSASPIILAVYAFLASTNGGFRGPHSGGFHVIAYFTLLASILGFSLGMSAYNMDYYMVAFLGADEKVVGTMYSYAYILAAASSTIIALKLRERLNPASGHVYAVAAQAAILTIMATMGELTPLILVYAIRAALGVLADSLFDTTYTRLAPESVKGLTISMVMIAYEISSGAGKLAGSLIADGSLWKPLVAASLIMATYTVIAPQIFKAMEPPERLRERREHSGSPGREGKPEKPRDPGGLPGFTIKDNLGHREKTIIISPPPGPRQRS